MALDGPAGPDPPPLKTGASAVMTRASHDLALRKELVMRRVIDAVGPQPSSYRERTDVETACRIIVDEQLSFAAATTIWGRVRGVVPRWRPAEIAALSADQLRALGLSRSKATYPGTCHPH